MSAVHRKSIATMTRWLITKLVEELVAMAITYELVEHPVDGLVTLARSMSHTNGIFQVQYMV